MKKRDEYYTFIEDIEKEIPLYISDGDSSKYAFQNKSVYMNCDTNDSNFWKYFVDNFDIYNLSKITATGINTDGIAYKYQMIRGENLDENGKEQVIKTPLKGNGDYSNSECEQLLDEHDIVCTNPPFSLFRDYIALLQKHKCKFLIIGNENALAYKEIFPYFMRNEIWMGKNKPKQFLLPDGGIKQLGLCCWYTNIDNTVRHTFLPLYRSYAEHEKEYQKYDNYDAIEVEKVVLIPNDYDGKMGVPITFFEHFCPEQFEVIGLFGAFGKKNTNIEDGLILGERVKANVGKEDDYRRGPVVNGIPKFNRIIIKKRKNTL